MMNSDRVQCDIPINTMGQKTDSASGARDVLVALDDSTPIIVGVSRLTRKPLQGVGKDWEDREPIEFMAKVGYVHLVHVYQNIECPHVVYFKT